MTEQVVVHVLLLNDKIATISIDKNAKGAELFEKVCSQSWVTDEREYFGLSYRDKDNNKFWLKKAKKIDKQLKGIPWQFQFQVKFYPIHPATVHSYTRYLIYLQVRRDVYWGKVPCSFMSHVVLGSYIVQCEFGDFTVRRFGRSYDYVTELSFLPGQNRKLIRSIAELHRYHRGISSLGAELHYLENACKLPLYGMSFYQAQRVPESVKTPVIETSDLDVALGVGARGLSEYRDSIRMHFWAWTNIIKFEYRKDKFWITSRPHDTGEKNNVFHYRLGNERLAKRLYTISAETHAFFRGKHSHDPSNADDNKNKENSLPDSNSPGSTLRTNHSVPGSPASQNSEWGNPRLGARGVSQEWVDPRTGSRGHGMDSMGRGNNMGNKGYGTLNSVGYPSNTIGSRPGPGSMGTLGSGTGTLGSGTGTMGSRSGTLNPQDSHREFFPGPQAGDSGMDGADPDSYLTSFPPFLDDSDDEYVYPRLQRDNVKLTIKMVKGIQYQVVKTIDGRTKLMKKTYM